MNRAMILGVSVLALGLSACSSVEVVQDYPRPVGSGERNLPQSSGVEDQRGGLLDLFGITGGGEEATGIGVNSFLWRASLDTLNFMPLQQADPFGGVIITDWYQPPETPGEQLKVTVYILDRALRADALRVAVFRQKRDNGAWVNADVDPQTVTQLENAILTRARQLRVAAAD